MTGEGEFKSPADALVIRLAAVLLIFHGTAALVNMVTGVIEGSFAHLTLIVLLILFFQRDPAPMELHGVETNIIPSMFWISVLYSAMSFFCFRPFEITFSSDGYEEQVVTLDAEDNGCIIPVRMKKMKPMTLLKSNLKKGQ